MKYQHSIQKAEKLLLLTINQLKSWQLAASPVNYSVGYEFVLQTNQALVGAIKYQLSTGKKLDDFYMEAVYQQFILGQSKFRDEIIDDLDGLLASIKKNSIRSRNSVNGFISEVDANLTDLKSGDEDKVTNACNNLTKATHQFKLQQQVLAKQLQEVEQNNQQLKNELEEVRQELYSDPLTGLHNRKAMSKHIEAWFKEDPNKDVAAIVINIDQYTQIAQRFGSLIGDVLLSKIASKIESYVDSSGLPIRTGGDEFLILLPDVDDNIAKEIGEKIRAGVSKLRFVSSRSGIRLPKMTISLGVNKFKVSQNINEVIDRTRDAMKPDE